MTVVPIQDVYVDANFKEEQLRHVRLGQPVVLTSDLYGGGVKFHGRVVGLAGGTGAAFAVIPAQNATGNWIKVVQRLPVRIALDPDELAAPSAARRPFDERRRRHRPLAGGEPSMSQTAPSDRRSAPLQGAAR